MRLPSIHRDSSIVNTNSYLPPVVYREAFPVFHFSVVPSRGMVVFVFIRTAKAIACAFGRALGMNT